MARPYLTLAEWAKKHDVPKRTAYEWVKSGKLEAMRWKYPMLIPDDQPVPKKDPDIHKWRYQFGR